jgi:hypothetical protein
MGKLGHDEDDDTADNQVDQNINVDDPNDDTDTTQQNQAEDATVPRVVEAEEDSRLASDSDDDSTDADEASGRKRESAKERRERARKAKERDKQDLALLRATTAKQDARLRELDKQLSVMQVSNLDALMATEIANAEQMDKIFGAAITAKNGEDARRAAELRDEAKQKAWGYYNQKQQILGVAQQKQNTPAEVPYKNQAMTFLSDKPWYNPGSGDEDSLIVEAMDKALSKKMNPNDPDYWSTLDKKVREKLPHKFESDESEDDDGVQDDEPRQQRQVAAPRRKGPPTGGSSRNVSSSRPGEIRLPAEMVAAMKEAGHWDDPKRRARVAQRYIDGVKNNQRNG